MGVEILSTPQATRSALETLVSGSERVRIAAAFVRRSGVDDLRLLQRPIPRLQVIAGTDFNLTEVEALKVLHAPPGRECRLYFAPDEGEAGVFHPKLYLGTAGSDFMAVVGSSNLTASAFTRNVELNVQITGSLTDPPACTLTEFFERLWTAPGVVDLNSDVVRAYRTDQAARRLLWRELRHSPEFRRARDLVRRTLLDHFAARAGRKWLLVTSGENYWTCLGRRRWGDENYRRISQIRPGDLLIFYIKGAQKLGAVAVAATPVYRSAEATWADRQYPYRIDFSLIVEPASPIDFRPLIPQLSFLPRKDEKWGTALQTSCLQLPDADAHRLLEIIKAVEAAPEPGLAAAEAKGEYELAPASLPEEESHGRRGS